MLQVIELKAMRLPVPRSGERLGGRSAERRKPHKFPLVESPSLTGTGTEDE